MNDRPGQPPLDIEAEAEQLLAAYTEGPLPPLTTRHPELSLDQAYAIQQVQIGRRLDRGLHRVGFKVGLTSVAMQQQFGVDQPDFGQLLSDMAFRPDEDIAVSAFLQPRAEPEFALVLGRGLTAGPVGEDQLADAVAWVTPAIEIIDSRIADWRITLSDTIADNASSGGFVLGETRVRPDEHDLAGIRCEFGRNATVEHVGTGADVLGSPLLAARWLVNTLLAQGAELDSGSVILTGSVTAALPVAPGDVVTATLLDLGSVTARFC